MLLTLLACFGSKEPETEVCADGWERPLGTCPEGEGDADTDTDTDSDTDADTGPDGDCDVDVDYVYPEDGAQDASILDPVRIEFGEPVSSGWLQLTGVEGELVWSEAEDAMTFWPAQPLDPSTTYEAVAEACDERAFVWRFKTSEHGTPLEGEVAGRTFRVALGEGRIIEPAGVGSVLESYIEGSILLEVVSIEGEELVLRGGAADGNTGHQDLCQPTDELTMAFEDPVFRYGPADTQLDIGGTHVGQLSARGVIAADGQSLHGLAISGLVDTRPWVDLVEPGGDDATICELVTGFGISCESCPDGSGAFCLQISIEGMQGELVDETLVPLETCDASCPEEDCGQCSCASGVGLRGGWLVALFALAGLSRRRRGDTART